MKLGYIQILLYSRIWHNVVSQWHFSEKERRGGGRKEVRMEGRQKEKERKGGREEGSWEGRKEKQTLNQKKKIRAWKKQKQTEEWKARCPHGTERLLETRDKAPQVYDPPKEEDRKGVWSTEKLRADNLRNIRCPLPARLTFQLIRERLERASQPPLGNRTCCTRGQRWRLETIKRMGWKCPCNISCLSFRHNVAFRKHIFQTHLQKWNQNVLLLLRLTTAGLP